MNPRALLGVVAGLAVAAVGVREALIIVTDEKPLAAQERCDTGAELSRESDGGRAYTCLVVVDAGEPDCRSIQPPEVCAPTFVRERRKLTQSTHVRAKRDDGTCLIREPLPGIDAGFKTPRYFGTGNRFPRAWAVGPGCEEVAGLVSDKADSDVDEAELLKRDAGDRIVWFDAGTKGGASR